MQLTQWGHRAYHRAQAHLLISFSPYFPGGQEKWILYFDTGIQQVAANSVSSTAHDGHIRANFESKPFNQIFYKYLLRCQNLQNARNYVHEMTCWKKKSDRSMGREVNNRSSTGEVQLKCSKFKAFSWTRKNWGNCQRKILCTNQRSNVLYQVFTIQKFKKKRSHSDYLNNSSQVVLSSLSGITLWWDHFATTWSRMSFCLSAMLM